MTQRLVVVGAMLLAVTVGVQAQSNPLNPLLGAWELNLSKSTYQHDAWPESETRSYKTCEGGGVETYVETTYAYSRVSVTTFCTRLDGKEYPYHSHIADKITETGADWRAFTATITKDGAVVRNTRTVVSEDGKTLTRTTSYPGDKGSDLQVYDKLPYR